MSYNTLRKGRFSGENQIYFVTTVIHKRRNLFTRMDSCRAVIQQMKNINDEGYIDSIAWVIMPDHIHWLFQLNEKNSLGMVMQKFKGNSARILNQLLDEKGSFWQKAYYDHALRKDEDIKEVARYIVANPLRAGLVERIEDYPHWDAVWV